MNLERFLTRCTNQELSSLYQSHWTVQAVLRSLPPLSKQYILRLLFVDDPVPKKNIDAWIKPEFKRKHDDAIKDLTQLAILQEHSLPSGDDGWALNPSFRSKLREAACGWGAAVEVVPAAVLEATPSKEQLDEYARQQWESLLLFLVGRRSKLPSLPRYMSNLKPLDIARLLQSAGLISDAPSSRGAPAITEAGFQFMLQPPALQLWALLDVYLATSGMQLAAGLGFLLHLGFRRVGQPCQLHQLAPAEQAIAAHCVQLGMLYPYQVGATTYFSPTALASSLTEGSATSQGATAVTGGHIIVETNYRVYSYTKSELQVALLQMICRMDCRLPNLFVGTLTRDSVHAALEAGITAEQIVAYLTQQAHPHVAHTSPIVPEVVSDQIRLWEADILRVQAEPAVLYSDFPSSDVFLKTVAYAQELGAYLWHHQQHQEIVARSAFQKELKAYIIQARAAAGFSKPAQGKK